MCSGSLGRLQGGRTAARAARPRQRREGSAQPVWAGSVFAVLRWKAVLTSLYLSSLICKMGRYQTLPGTLEELLWRLLISGCGGLKFPDRWPEDPASAAAQG